MAAPSDSSGQYKQADPLFRSAIWGAVLVSLCGIVRSTDLFFRVDAMRAIPVPVLIFWEHLINLVAVSPILWHERACYRLIGRREAVLFVLVGAGASAMGILCFTTAFRYVNPALAVLLQKLQPLFTIGLGMFFIGDRPFPGFFRWAVPAIAASYFVSFSLVNPFSSAGATAAAGMACAVGAAFFWGSGTVWGKLLLRRFGPHFIMANRFLVGTVFSGLVALLWHGDLAVDQVWTGTVPLWSHIAYMALGPGLIATTLFYQGLQWVEASLSSIVELVFPLSSVFIMWVFFARPLDAVQVASGLVLCWCIVILTRRQDAFRRSTTTSRS
jgi:drug/metabolite transporter, DME family